MKDVGGAGFDGSSPPFLSRERAAVDVDVGPERLMMMMFIPRGWNLFFSGTGTADFHPEVLEKARPISPLR